MDYAAKTAMSAGVLLALLGLVSLAIPIFTTEHTENVATIGGLQIQTAQNTPHLIPREMSWGTLALGMVLIGGGIYRKR